MATFKLTNAEVEAIRAHYLAINGTETTLNREQIVAAAEKADLDADDADGWAEALAKVEATLNDTADASDDEEGKAEAKPDKIAMSRVSTEAVAYANVLATDTEFTGLLSDKVKRDEEENIRPLALVRRFQATLGKERLDKAPIVGTDDTDCGNRMPDQYKYSITNQDGTKTPVTGSFWRDLAEALPEAKSYFKAIEDMRLKAEGQKGQGIAIQNRDVLRGWEGKIKSIVKAVRQAARLYQAMDRINTECGEVEAYHYAAIQRDESGKVLKDEEGKTIRKLSRTPTPIYVGSTNKDELKSTDEAMWDFYSVSQVLSFDVDKAKANGGGYAALEASRRRVVKKGKADVPDASFDNLPTFIANPSALLVSEENQRAVTKSLERAINAGKHEFLLAIADYRDLLSNIIAPFEENRRKIGKPSILIEIRNQMDEADKALKEGKAAQDKAVKTLVKAAG